MMFVIVGRRNHDEDSALVGTLTVAAPFLIALGLAWIATRAWRRPTAVQTGLLLWPITLVAGMLLRRFVFDDGTAAAFVIVATLVLGCLLVGWRAAWSLVSSRRVRPSTR